MEDGSEEPFQVLGRHEREALQLGGSDSKPVNTSRYRSLSPRMAGGSAGKQTNAQAHTHAYTRTHV